MTRNRRFIALWRQLVILLPLLSPSLVLGQSNASRLVVVLYPDGNDGRPGSLLFDRGLRSLLRSDSPDHVEIHSEFLDLSRSTTPEYPQQLATFLEQKYRGRKVDAVVAGLAPTLDFALRYRTAVFPSAPVILGAIDQREITARQLPPDVIGNPIFMDLKGTLDLALTLHPGTRNLFVVSGASAFDSRWESEARRAFRPYAQKLQIEYLSGLPVTDLTQQISQLPEHSLVYYLHVFQDSTNSGLIPAEVLELLAEQANAPIYGHVDSYIGRGVVGGKMFRWEISGQNAARTVLRLIAGEEAAAIGIQQTSPSVANFDWNQLQRWQISEASLPFGSVIHNQTPGLWDLYKWHIVGVVTLCILQGVTIAGMLIQRVQRTQAERRFRLAVDAAPNGMLMVAQDGRIVLANRTARQLFGYVDNELLEQSIELLVPDRYRDRHVKFREEFFFAVKARPMGAGQSLFGRRKDGTEFPVEIALNPLRTDFGLCVLASVIDMTEKRAAERLLMENQQELRLLTAQLLTTQEEERRRIARDLHDDFGQTLALFSVQIDLCRQRAGDDDGLATALEDLSQRSRELSSAIHDLSHQLHPFKLEQLGLVVALRSLCTECSQKHPLEIEFSHDRIPESIPRDLALCLFRIAQEALRNAIKHSQAEIIHVSLEGTIEGIRLNVADNGAGFPLSQIDHPGGLGLISTRERLRPVCGSLTVHSEPGEGTRIEVWVPFPSTCHNSSEES